MQVDDSETGLASWLLLIFKSVLGASLPVLAEAPPWLTLLTLKMLKAQVRSLRLSLRCSVSINITWSAATRKYLSGNSKSWCLPKR